MSDFKGNIVANGSKGLIFDVLVSDFGFKEVDGFVEVSSEILSVPIKFSLAFFEEIFAFESFADDGCGFYGLFLCGNECLNDFFDRMTVNDNGIESE